MSASAVRLRPPCCALRLAACLGLGAPFDALRADRLSRSSVWSRRQDSARSAQEPATEGAQDGGSVFAVAEFSGDGESFPEVVVQTDGPRLGFRLVRHALRVAVYVRPALSLACRCTHTRSILVYVHRSVV